MSGADMVLHPEEYERIREVISRLRSECNAKMIFLVDKNGQQIAAQGEIDALDTTALASLAAGNVAATDSLARLIGEKEFSILFHEGERDNLHISVVGGKAILEDVWSKAAAPRKAAAGGSPFSEITDEDIDRLFSD